MLAESHPYIRRIIRFCLLPYCYFKLVPWHECTRSRIQVFKDLLYIFFKFKYFPNNYGLCRLWEQERKKWEFYYGSSYDPYQRKKLRPFVQRYEYQIVFNDKELCDQFCRGLNVTMPRYFGSIEIGESYREKIKKYLIQNNENELFLKPIMGHAGQGIMKATVKQGEVVIKTKTGDVGIKNFILLEKCVVQEAVLQHEAISQIAPSSVNTIRVVTLLTKHDDVIIVGALMRFSKENSFIDNTSAGGISVGINYEQGQLRKRGFDFSGLCYEKHPISGIEFTGFQIPKWNKVVEMAVIIQKYCKFYRLIGVDIAVTSNGPVLIEVNANPDIIGIEQANRPILADKRVFDEFVKYDLLINNYQRALYD